MLLRVPRIALFSLVALLLCSCGSGSADPGASTSGAALVDWPEFGLDAQRHDCDQNQ